MNRLPLRALLAVVVEVNHNRAMCFHETSFNLRNEWIQFSRSCYYLPSRGEEQTHRPCKKPRLAFT